MLTTDVADVARAGELTLRLPGLASVVLNVGTGKNHSVMDMLAAATFWDRGSWIVDEKALSSSAHYPLSTIRYLQSAIHNPLSTIRYLRSSIPYRRIPATRVATPDPLPGRTGFLTPVARGCRAT